MMLNDIPGLNLLPVQWQPYVVLIAVAGPVVGRIWHGIASGGGTQAALRGAFLGTQAPIGQKDPSATTDTTTTPATPKTP